MSAGTAKLVFDREVKGELYRFTWIGSCDAPVSRVRAFAFPEPGKLVLVRGDDGLLQIPGGGVEDGEQPFEALARELCEEASASILSSYRLGAFQIEGLTRDLREVHDYYSCRVRLAPDWAATHDISERVVVSSHQFLDALPWGRSDQAEFLLQRALEVEPLL